VVGDVSRFARVPRFSMAIYDKTGQSNMPCSDSPLDPYRPIDCALGVDAGRESCDCEEFRAYPSQQSGGYGLDSSVLQGGRGRGDAVTDWLREV